MKFDHLLILGFGAPTKAEEVRPFLEIVTRGRAIPAERLLEVERHYEQIGGASPYNEQVFCFAGALRRILLEQGIELPVFVGMRNWKPFLRETAAEIKKLGLKKGIGFVLSPFRSEPSYGRYVENLEEILGSDPNIGVRPQYEFIEPWHEHPLWIEALAASVKEKLEAPAGAVQVIFSAHSIPKSSEGKGEARLAPTYEEQFKTTCRLVANLLGLTDWTFGYQSRSGSPRDPWLGPALKTLLPEAKARHKKGVLLVPCGFLCDNAEILYDLDIEIKQETEKLGLEYRRAETVLNSPEFVKMVIALARGRVSSPRKRGSTNGFPLKACGNDSRKGE